MGEDLLTTCLKFIGITTKAAVRAGMGGGFTYALGKELDNYLIEQNKRPIFIPAIQNAAASVCVDKPIVRLVDIIADQLEVEEIEDKDTYKIISNLSKETGLSKEEMNRAISNAKLKKNKLQQLKKQMIY